MSRRTTATVTTSEHRSGAGGRRWPWWHQRSTAFRRTVRTTLTIVVAGVLAVLFGVTTAQFTGSLGPHEADYSTTWNSEVRIDMGPLGSLVIDSPMPLGLGADVVVKEIPVELASETADPVAGLTADLASYSQFLANPEASIREAAFGVVRDAVGRTVLAWSLLLCIVAFGRLASHGVLRAAAKSAWRQQGVPAMAVGVTVALLVPIVVDATRGSGPEGETSQVLAGTPLADARITGRLGSIVDFYGGYVVDAIDENTAFYAEVETNLRQALENDPEPTAPTLVPAVVPMIEPTDGEDPADPDTDQPEDTDQPVDDAERAEPDPVNLTVVTDLHCNIGMAPVIGAFVELTASEAVLNVGDTVMGGTSVESVCVNAFADGFGDGVPVVVADGNHDSETTAEQEADRGWTVLRGEPVEVAGVRILGDRDPMLTSLGAPTHPQRDETFEEMSARLNEVACAASEAGEPIDILLVHNERAAQTGLQTGCTPFTLNGHLHRRIGPWQTGLGVQYMSASTAGATKDTPTIGPLQNTATITVIRYDRANHEPMDFRVVHIGVDRTVTLGSWWSFPPRPDEPVDLEVPAPGEGPWDADPAS